MFGKIEENLSWTIWRYILTRYFPEKTEDNHEHVMHSQAKHTTLVYLPSVSICNVIPARAFPFPYFCLTVSLASLPSTLYEPVIPFPQNRCVDLKILWRIHWRLHDICSLVVSENLVFTQCEFDHTRIETKTIENKLLSNQN